jgi:hypothetical protein
MFLQVWRFVTLLLAALGLAMGLAHVLELAPKMEYDAHLYSAVNTTMYRYFGIVGSILQVGALVAGAVLAYLVRGRRSLGLALAGTLCLALSLGLWAALVAPVNSEVAAAMRSAPETVPSLWMDLRERWEYGHVEAFGAWLLGACLIVGSVLREIPAGRRSEEPTGGQVPERARANAPR